MTLDDALKVHEIGWQWFSVHAQQRMQIVSFWFVAMSFLSTGAVLAYGAKNYGAAALVGFAILGASVIFLLLDLRTRELISYGERLMLAMEKTIDSISPVPEVLVVDGMHAQNRRTVSYRTLFTSLYGGAGMLGLLTVILAVKAL